MAADSLFIGVSGIDAYQNQLDVISNNIANVGTTGYKGQSVNFQDLLYQTQGFASAPTQTNGGVDGQQVGLGVKIGSIDSSFTQGGQQTTGVNTNLMLNGDGFFIMNNTQGNGQPSYTRNGDFTVNQDGLLIDPASGLAVMGFTADKAGNVVSTATPGPIQIPLGLKSQAVGTGDGTKTGPTGDKSFDISYGGNLDQSLYASAVSNAGVGAALVTTSTTIFDSLGGSHRVTVTFQPAVSAATTGFATLPLQVNNAQGTPVTAATEWAYTVTSTDGTTFNGPAGTTSTTTQFQYAFFDQNGQFINTSSTATPAAGTTHLAGQPPAAASGDQFSVAQWGTPAGATNATTGALPPASGPIGIDFSNMSSLSGASTGVGAPTTISQNGFTSGTLSNVTVGQDGTIDGAFSNGQTQVVGRVAVATFQNEQGLTRIGGSSFIASANSGLAQIGTANSGRLGAIVSGALEQSNVSIADEFTKMIEAQNSYQANSKSITTASEDLQTVIGLIR